MGIAFDPDFNNTHYIYVAYTYDNISSSDAHGFLTKITHFTYNPENLTISEPCDD
jgi:hypothetical protein